MIAFRNAGLVDRVIRTIIGAAIVALAWAFIHGGDSWR